MTNFGESDQPTALAATSTETERHVLGEKRLENQRPCSLEGAALLRGTKSV
jgi:hypothetical protein